jgi:hypothetical protein
VKKSEMSPEAQARDLEKKLNALIEASCISTFTNREPRIGLEKAKEAQKKVIN